MDSYFILATHIGHGVGRGARLQQQVDNLAVPLLGCLQ